MALTRFNVQNGLSVGTGSIGVIDSEGAGTFTNLTSTGNLTVLGENTFISSSNVQFASNFINLNVSQNPAVYGGIYFKDVNSGQVGSLIWDSYTNQWLQGLKGSEQAFPMGVGTINALVKWDGFTSLSSSIIFDNGTNVGIGRTQPTNKLDIAGGLTAAGPIVMSGSLSLGSDGIYDLGDSQKKARTVFANYLTGSLTTLSDGSPYLVAGPNMIITTGSSGELTLEATLAAGTISGLGTLNYLPKYASAGTVTESNIFDDGAGVSVLVPLTASYFKSDLIESNSITGILTASNLQVGSIVFAGDDGLLTGSQGSLFWDRENRGIGIGTSLLRSTSAFTVSGSSEFIGDIYSSGSLLPTADSLYALGSTTNKWSRVHARALSGSLTTLSDGTPYLLAGTGMSLSTGSNGAITLSYAGINLLSPGLGLVGGGSSGNVSLAINDGIVATISGSTFTGAVKFNGGLSGSLTRLTDGTPAFNAGGNMSIVTGSNGSLTFSTINSGTIHGVTAGNGLLGGGTSGTVGLVVNDAVVATVSGSTFTGAVKFNGGLSGSLTRLTNGSPFIVAGDNVMIATGSLGEITISSTAGGTINGEGDPNYITKWRPGNELTGSKIYDDGQNVKVLIPMSVTGSLLPGENSQFNLGSVTKFWNTVYSEALTGSLTRLSNGDPYLVAGSGISLSTGSSGQVTIVGNVGTITNVTPGPGLIGGGSSGNATLSIDDAIVATVSGSTFTGAVKFNGGLSGSLQRLASGEPYIAAGSNVTITTSSQGTVVIDVVAGGGGALVDGFGIPNYSTRWQDTNTLTYGTIYDSGAAVGIGTVSGGDVFTVSGSASLTGSFLPGLDSTYNIGSPTKRWSNLHALTVSGSRVLATSLTGSLTKLSNGTDYLIAGSGIQLTTGALGNITITSALALTNIDPGTVLFTGLDGGLTGSSTRLFWDRNNNRLGIGTSSPTSALTVVGTSHFTGSLIPGANSTYSLGTPTNVWSNLYATTISGTLIGSGLTQGSLLFANASGVVSQDNSKIFWDDNNNRLGVGTNSPIYALEVYGTNGSLFSVEDNMSGSLLSISGISGIPIFEVFSDFKAVFNSGFNATTATITGSFVGLGTSSGNARLHVYGTNNSSAPVTVIQASSASPSGKLLDIRNFAGTSVASIDYLGNISGSLGSLGSNLTAVNGNFTGDVVIGGNLTVNGSSVNLNAQTVTVKDNVITVNAGDTFSPTGGLFVNDTFTGFPTNGGSLLWSNSTNRWSAGRLGSEQFLVTTGSTDTLLNKTLSLGGANRNFITGGLLNTVVFFDNTGSLVSSNAFSYNSSTGLFRVTGSIFSFTGSLTAITSSIEPGVDSFYDLGTSTKKWNNVVANKLTGSLTTLSDGTSYLLAGSNIILQTGSNGAILITAQSSGGSGGGSAVGGFGTAGRVTRWVGTIDLGDSSIYDDGTNVGIGGVATGDRLTVYGSTTINGSTVITGSITPGTDSIYDLGTSVKRWRSLNALSISGSLTGSGFLSGTVVFAGPGGVLTGSNTQLFWNIASSSLGIGTNNPSGKFEVYSTSSGSLFSVTDTLSGSLLSVNTISGLSAFEVFSDYRVFAGSPATNDFAISGSRVGIGTSQPISRFQVIGSNSLTVPTAVLRAGIASPTAPVLDVQTSTGTPVFTVSGSGNVGIGTAVITYNLDVFPTTATARIGQGLLGTWPSNNTHAMFGHSSLSHVAAGNYALLQNSVGDTFLNAASTKTVYMRINNTDIAAVNATGVGIGTTNPGFSLQLGSNTTGVSTATPQTISLGSTFSNTAGANAKLRLYFDGASLIYGLGVSSNQLDYIAPTSANHVWYIAGTEYVRMTTTGVGLGTNNPGFRLQLGNNTAASTATPETINMGGTYSSTAGSNAKLRLYNDGTNVTGLSVSNNQLEYIGHSTVSHVWYIGGTERARINTTGNVGIGTATYSARLHVSGSTTNTDSLLVLRPGVPLANTARLIDAQNSAGTPVFVVSGSGAVGIGISQPAGPLQVVGVSGSLLLITDNISGSLLSVNNVTGLPILEVFSDNRMVVGRYGQNTLVVSGSRIAMGALPTNDIELLLSGSPTSSDRTLVIRAGVQSPTGTLIEAQTFTSSSVFWVSGSGAAFFSGSVRSPAFSGSLTTLSDGSPYLVAGPGILLVTQSNGSLYITSSATAGLSAGGLATYVQFNDGGTLGGDANFTFNKTTDTLSVTNISGSLTKLASGADYLVAGGNITLSTGSNGSITINAAITPYTTASFTNVTSLTVNHNLGITLYDIEVFDTSYNKIFPKSATATSTTQANITFGIPTSGYVTVGGSGGGGGISDLGGLSTNISTSGQITGSLVYSTGLLTGSRLTTSGPITGSLVNSTSTVTANVPFYLANTTISANYTVPAGFNAMTPGPITISDGVTVTVSDGSTWTVV